jgi:hypothetical protein
MAPYAERLKVCRYHAGRDLCQVCMASVYYNGTVEDWPRRTYTNAELLDEAFRLMSTGSTRAQAAERLGIKDHSLRTAISRARRRQKQDA